MKERYAKILLLATQLTVIAFAFTLSFPDCAYSDSDLQKTGDVLAIALPLTAFGTTFYYDDPEGRAQFLKSIATSTLLVYASKETISKIRPGDWDEDSGKSYPSGHTQSAFSGASFLQTRYGYKFGIPAYLLAGLTAYSRVDAQAHFLDDVMIGASIGMLCNWYYTTPYSKKIGFTPIVDDDRYGLAVHLPMESTPKARLEKADHPYLRFTLQMGPSWATEAKAKSPSGSGTEIDLTEFDDDPVPNGFIRIEYLINKRHDVAFKMMPVEYRQNGMFTSPVSFAGLIFPADTPSRIRYRLNEYQLRYRYGLLLGDPWSLKVGLGLGYYDAKVELINATQSVSASEWSLLPLVHLHLGYTISSEWRVSAEDEFFYSSDHWRDEFRALVHYQINPNWEVSGGYRIWAGEIDESSLEYKYTYQGLTAGITYSFY